MEEIKEELVGLPSSYIRIFPDPRSRSKVLRFAFMNGQETKYKFIGSNKIYDRDEVELFADCDILHFELRGVFSKRSLPITRLTDFAEYKDRIKSRIYSQDEVDAICQLMAPYILSAGQKCTLPEWLELENRFVNYQKEVLKECETCDDDQTNAYCKF